MKEYYLSIAPARSEITAADLDAVLEKMGAVLDEEWEMAWIIRENKPFHVVWQSFDWRLSGRYHYALTEKPDDEVKGEFEFQKSSEKFARRHPELHGRATNWREVQGLYEELLAERREIHAKRSKPQ